MTALQELPVAFDVLPGNFRMRRHKGVSMCGLKDDSTKKKPLCASCVRICVNPLNAELNPICYLLALLGAHHILHVSRVRVKILSTYIC